MHHRREGRVGVNSSTDALMIMAAFRGMGMELSGLRRRRSSGLPAIAALGAVPVFVNINWGRFPHGRVAGRACDH